MVKKILQESKDNLWWLALILGSISAVMLIIQYIFPWTILVSEVIWAYAIAFPAYVTVKELVRWSRVESKPRLGEIFFWVWWGLFIVMGLVQWTKQWTGIPENTCQISQEIIAICIEVLGVYVAGEISKKYFHTKNSNKKKAAD